MRSCSVDSDSLRAVLVMACSGCSIRPASSQAEPKVMTVMMARASSDQVQSWRSASSLQLAAAPRRAVPDWRRDRDAR